METQKTGLRITKEFACRTSDALLEKRLGEIVRRAGKEPEAVIVVTYDSDREIVDIRMYHDFGERYPLRKIFLETVRNVAGLWP